MKSITTSIVLCTVLSISGAAQAALLDRGGGLIYDTNLNVTWLQDANYAKTSGYDADGVMTWSQATTWADNLSYYDIVRMVTYSDWRLPIAIDTGAPGCNFHYSGTWNDTYNGTDCGYNVNTETSEMAHLFYEELHNKALYDTSGSYQPDWGLIHKIPFNNFQPSPYWSGNAMDADHAWSFDFRDGGQFANAKASGFSALAVRPGDVATVPVPAAAWLFGSGLLGLVSVARRKARH